MATERVKCIDCENMILPQTAAANGGLCAQCARVSESVRKERRAFERQLESGLLFTPSQEELASKTIPDEFGNPDTAWLLEPEYYAEQKLRSVRDVLVHAGNLTNGDVFLVSNSGSRLNLSFTSRFGVCELQKEDSGDYLYAYTCENLSEQVPEELHVVQACPCCGVGMLWYPSRFHMPRKRAFEIIDALTQNTIPANVAWLAYGDISHTSRGQG